MYKFTHLKKLTDQTMSIKLVIFTKNSYAKN